ncbi:hypothetical protein XOCgx_0126 [Xanthomonas oryzae pv. oryzicola]|nr:hypothetical protein XOCgx_0126 [Xanthomonas oryzae pv. oryzicola]
MTLLIKPWAMRAVRWCVGTEAQAVAHACCWGLGDGNNREPTQVAPSVLAYLASSAVIACLAR